MFNYFYVIRSETYNKYYIGSRSSEFLPEKDLLVRYFTSSKVVLSIIINSKNIYEFDIIKIKLFNNKKELIEYENKILKSIKNKEKFLNINFSAGGAVLINKTHTYITKDNKIFERYLRGYPLPIGYKEKWPFSPPSRKGLKKITNGIFEYFIFPEEKIPNGYYYKKDYIKLLKNGNKKRISTFWYNNGKINKRFSKDKILELNKKEWIPGRLSFGNYKKRNSSSTLGKICINNGKTNKFIDPNNIIPIGWNKGMIR